MWILVHTLVVMGNLQQQYIGTYETMSECKQAANQIYQDQPADQRSRVQMFDCVKSGEKV